MVLYSAEYINFLQFTYSRDYLQVLNSPIKNKLSQKEISFQESYSLCFINKQNLRVNSLVSFESRPHPKRKQNKHRYSLYHLLLSHTSVTVTPILFFCRPRNQSPFRRGSKSLIKNGGFLIGQFLRLTLDSPSSSTQTQRPTFTTSYLN